MVGPIEALNNKINAARESRIEKSATPLDAYDKSTPWADYYNSMKQQFAGTDYEDLFNSNPYTPLIDDYRNSFFDDIKYFFGAPTRLDQLQQSSAEYMAQIAQLQREEKYNSESAQTSRMREAGLNPDLLGTSGASQATGFDMAHSSPDAAAMAGTNLGFAQNIISGIGSCIDAALGIYGKFEGFKSLVLENQEKQFKLDGSARALAEQVSDSLFGRPLEYSYDKKSRMGSLMYALNDDEKRGFETHGFREIQMNRSNWRRFVEQMKNYHGSVFQREKMNIAFNSSSRNRDEYGQRIASDFSAPENEPAEVISHLYKPLAKLQDLTLKQNTSNAYKMSQRTSKEIDIFDPTLENNAYRAGLGAEAEEGRSRYENARFQNTVRKTVREMTQAIQKDADRGNGFAQALMFAMGVMSLSQGSLASSASKIGGMVAKMPIK